MISDVTYCRGALLRARADGFGLADCNADSIPDACQIDENDCNGNGMPDDCDAIEGGDFTGNGEVDLEDFSAFADCLAGPNRAPTPPQSGCADVCLRAFDFAEDEDVDLDDFSALQQRFGQWFGAAGRGASTPRTGDREDPPKQRETGEPPIVPKIGVVLH